MTVTSQEDSDKERFYDIPSQDTSLNTEHDEHDVFSERSSLLERGRQTTRTPSIYRSRSLSISSSRIDSESSTLSIWTLTRTQKIVLATTSIVDLLSFLSMSIMAPFFPEEALKKDVSDTLSGWIFGTSPFVQFLASPFIGKLMPHAGVKFMSIAGMFIFSGCTILFGLLAYVPSDNGNGVFIALSFTLQVVRSIGITSASTGSFVLCVQHFPDNISSVFGFGEIFVGLGLVAGPAVGGLLYGVDGFYLPFVSIGVLAMLCVPFMIAFIPSDDQAPASDSETDNEKVPFTKIFCSPNGILTVFTIVASTFMWSILDPTLEPHLRKFNLRPELVGVIFLVMAAAYAVTAPLWGWISDKLDDQRLLLMVGFLFACLGSLLIGPSPLIGLDEDYYQLWLVVLALVVLGASASLSSVPTFDMFFMLAENAGCENGTATYCMVSAFWMSMYSLGDFLGPSAGGFLLDYVGFNLMTTYSAGLCLFMACLLVLSWLCDLKAIKKCRQKPTDVKVYQAYDTFTSNDCYTSSMVE
ncbi:MFS-type transporter SLC18B1-like [Ruditapes philippinarum]|uniref:MFS-type transporter SLC18B1-like n=1 Tax=Ruditapes philippinarum TaxID=129788 RepID=UPI00295C2CFF|nr:MFS-type transporter SLC18B1-like [Ruditapes philippinarum]XP_060572337.1 MFS-type transporter SLC18B1-like [Ruditapes philippinarum]